MNYLIRYSIYLLLHDDTLYNKICDKRFGEDNADSKNYLVVTLERMNEMSAQEKQQVSAINMGAISREFVNTNLENARLLYSSAMTS